MSEATPIHDAQYDYANGVLGAQSYVAGGLTIPSGKQYNVDRIEVTYTLGHGAMASLRSAFVNVSGPADGYGYGSAMLVRNYGAGLANGDYVRAEGMPGSRGPVIAHKTAVRGPVDQWAVWGYQVTMGPGAKAAFMIDSDISQQVTNVPHVFVISGYLNPQVVLQWNAQPGATGVLFRVYRGTELTSELTADGVLRVRRIEYLP